DRDPAPDASPDQDLGVGFLLFESPLLLVGSGFVALGFLILGVGSGLPGLLRRAVVVILVVLGGPAFTGRPVFGLGVRSGEDVAALRALDVLANRRSLRQAELRSAFGAAEFDSHEVKNPDGTDDGR